MIVSLIAESLSGRWGPTRAKIFAWLILLAIVAALLLVGKCTVDMVGGA